MKQLIQVQQLVLPILIPILKYLTVYRTVAAMIRCVDESNNEDVSTYSMY